MPEIKHTDTDGLLSPFSMRDLVLKNRVVMSPLTRLRAGTERLANALITSRQCPSRQCQVSTYYIVTGGDLTPMPSDTHAVCTVNFSCQIYLKNWYRCKKDCFSQGEECQVAESSISLAVGFLGNVMLALQECRNCLIAGHNPAVHYCTW